MQNTAIFHNKKAVVFQPNLISPSSANGDTAAAASAELGELDVERKGTEVMKEVTGDNNWDPLGVKRVEMELEMQCLEHKLRNLAIGILAEAQRL